MGILLCTDYNNWCIVGQLIPKKHVPYTSALVLGTLWGKFDEGDCTLGISLLSKLPLHDFALLGGDPVHLNLVWTHSAFQLSTLIGTLFHPTFKTLGCNGECGHAYR